MPIRHTILVVAIAIVDAPLNLSYPGPQWLNAPDSDRRCAADLGVGALAIVGAQPRTNATGTPARAARRHRPDCFAADPSPTHPGVHGGGRGGACGRCARATRFGTPIPKNARGRPPKIDPVGTPAPQTAADAYTGSAVEVVISATR